MKSSTAAGPIEIDLTHLPTHDAPVRDLGNSAKTGLGIGAIAIAIAGMLALNGVNFGSAWTLIAAFPFIAIIGHFTLARRALRQNMESTMLEPYDLSIAETRKRLNHFRLPLAKRPRFQAVLSLVLALPAAIITGLLGFLVTLLPGVDPNSAVVLANAMAGTTALLCISNAARLWIYGGGLLKFVFGALTVIIVLSALLAARFLFLPLLMLASEQLPILQRLADWAAQGVWPAIAVGALALASLGTLAWVGFAAARFIAQRAAALTFRTSTQAQRWDQRRPILFLRAFADDLASIAQHDDVVRLEEVLAHELRTFGPFIAIGQPGEVRMAGAARNYLREDEWRQVVRQQMQDASIVVVIAGVTAGLRWELTTLAQDKHEHKTIVVFPADTTQQATRFEHVRLLFEQNLRDRPQFSRVGAARYIHLLPRGELVAINCGETASQYRLGLLAAVYGILGAHR